MAKRESVKGGELFIVDNSEKDWKVLRYLHDWCQISSKIDIATGFFEIGSLLALKDEWQKVDKIRILMGDEVSKRTQKCFKEGLENIKARLDDSLEKEKQNNDFLAGVPAIADAIRKGKIECRVYRKDKFHAKAYITHARMEVVGASALVGSSNFTYPGISENIELNVQITGRPVTVLQEWYEEHWADAEDVTPDILDTIDRHVKEYSPFEIYARSLQEFFRSHEMTADEWEKKDSTIYKTLATYQKDGYHSVLKKADKYKGAFLCDGVGLGKTFIGLMLIERLVKHEGKGVALFVPKSAKEAVWEATIKRYIPEILDGFYSFRIYSHTDLLRTSGDYPFKMNQIREQADAIIIDEAHHFRNTGLKGENENERKSRYWQMYDLTEDKQMYMLTATPVNNRLVDFQHMVELFSRHQADYFKDAPLGIHSLRGHIRKIEKHIEKNVLDTCQDDIDIDMTDADEFLRQDSLFEELVVQRSRSFVKKSLAQEDGQILFPDPSPPKVVEYSVKQTYGKLLKMVEDAFNKSKPLFSLAMYYPWEYYTGDEVPDAMVQGRQKQVVSLIRTSFLKRFESSAKAFELSCRTLMKKLVAFYAVNAETKREHSRLEKWMKNNKELTGYGENVKQLLMFDDDLQAEMQEEDVVEAEFFENAEKLDRKDFDVPEILADTLSDLDTIAQFLLELNKFKPSQDKKLRAIVKLLKNDSVLSKHKCLIFSEFKDTARYLAEQLAKEGFEGIAEIDSDTTGNMRVKKIQEFSPYYNGTSSSELKEHGRNEIRVLVSTDVLAEGLNLQDATRLINYDLHWNPVRLMQRIGRTDRRMNPEIEAMIVADHPDQEKLRGTVQYYNFIPPDELNKLLSLYRTVTHKTLRISKTFGIENGKLLTPDDEYDTLKNFIEAYEGTESTVEKMHLELQKLFKDSPELEEQLLNMPNRVFSGKELLEPDTRAVFFCYARPAKSKNSKETDATGWTIEAGDVQWYLYDCETGKIITEPGRVAKIIRSEPNTERVCKTDQLELKKIREIMDKHIKNTYLKKVQAPIGVKPVLRAWMEVN